MNFIFSNKTRLRLSFKWYEKIWKGVGNCCRLFGSNDYKTSDIIYTKSTFCFLTLDKHSKYLKQKLRFAQLYWEYSKGTSFTRYLLPTLLFYVGALRKGWLILCTKTLLFVGGNWRQYSSRFFFFFFDWKHTHT